MWATISTFQFLTRRCMVPIWAHRFATSLPCHERLGGQCSGGLQLRFSDRQRNVGSRRSDVIAVDMEALPCASLEV